MSTGGSWQPPQPGEPGGSFAPPSSPTVDLEPSPSPAPRPRSRGKVIAGVVGAFAVVGAGVFAVTRFTGDSSAGGAATPEEAGLSLLTALENEDALGAIDLLLPGEREALGEPLTQLVDELGRLEVLSDDANLSAVSGVDIVLEDESVEVEETTVDDIVNLRISASGTATVDGDELPIGDWVLDNLDDEALAELSSKDEPMEDAEFPVAAVREDGRWYLSTFYSAAEAARTSMPDAPDIPAEGVTPVGGDSPQDAIDNLLAGIENLDLEAIIAALNPDEFGALQRYAPLFLEDAQAELDNAGVELTIDDPQLTESGSGDRRSISVDGLRVDATVEGESTTVELTDGCWIVTAADETVDSCEQPEDMPSLDELFEDAQPVADLLASVQETFADYVNPGFIVKQVDGEWYVSPLASGADQFFALIGALDREEIEELQAQVEEVLEMDEFQLSDAPEDEFLDELPDDEAVPATIPTDDNVAADPSEICYAEDEAAAAAACFEALVASGTIDPVAVPVYLRHPECGLAEISWSGDFYSLPDADFVAVVEEAAPCFQGLVSSGELDAFDLPLELSNPECLQGRNWYTVTDEAELDALFECAYG